MASVEESFALNKLITNWKSNLESEVLSVYDMCQRLSLKEFDIFFGIMISPVFLSIERSLRYKGIILFLAFPVDVWDLSALLTSKFFVQIMVNQKTNI